jgi:hypothetical protein
MWGPWGCLRRWYGRQQKQLTKPASSGTLTAVGWLTGYSSIARECCPPTMFGKHFSLSRQRLPGRIRAVNILPNIQQCGMQTVKIIITTHLSRPLRMVAPACHLLLPETSDRATGTAVPSSHQSTLLEERNTILAPEHWQRQNGLSTND